MPRGPVDVQFMGGRRGLASFPEPTSKRVALVSSTAVDVGDLSCSAGGAIGGICIAARCVLSCSDKSHGERATRGISEVPRAGKDMRLGRRDIATAGIAAMPVSSAV